VSLPSLKWCGICIWKPIVIEQRSGLVEMEAMNSENRLKSPTSCQKDEYNDGMMLGVPFIYYSGAKKAFAPTLCSKQLAALRGSRKSTRSLQPSTNCAVAVPWAASPRSLHTNIEMSAHSANKSDCQGGTDCGEAWISRVRHHISLAGPESRSNESTPAQRAPCKPGIP
jgi:hypothetical protein